MLALAQSPKLLANYLLPDVIPNSVEWIFLIGLLATLAAALIGARVTAAPFRCTRILGVVVGVMTGVILSPLALGVSVLFVNLTAR